MTELMEMVGDNPVWQSLRAIQGDRFITLDKSLYHNKANHRYDEAYRVMAQYLYPDSQF